MSSDAAALAAMTCAARCRDISLLLLLFLFALSLIIVVWFLLLLLLRFVILLSNTRVVCSIIVDVVPFIKQHSKNGKGRVVLLEISRNYMFATQPRTGGRKLRPLGRSCTWGSRLLIHSYAEWNHRHHGACVRN
jgi:hypothetical protein